MRSRYRRIWIGFLLAICIVSGNCVSAAGRLVLPGELKVIGKEAFLGVQADEIVLPDGVKHIDSRAFYGGSILLPDSLEYIAPDAFVNTKGTTAIIEPGSYAHAYCIGAGISYKTLMPVGGKKKICFEYAGETFIACESDEALIAVVDEKGVVSGLSNGMTFIVVKNAAGQVMKIPVEVKGYADMNKALCVAHRGASGYYRENTIMAFEYAQTLGADIAELDVHKTKDGILVVYHDTTIKSGDTKKYISGLTLKALLKLDSRICTLKQAIECIAGTDMRVMVEFKATGITEDVLAVVKDGGMADRALYSGFDLATLHKMEQLYPSAQTAYSINSAAVVSAMIASPEKYGVDIALVNYKYLTKENVRDLHLSGKQVYAWTVNTREGIAACVAIGVDGILTNYPDYM